MEQHRLTRPDGFEWVIDGPIKDEYWEMWPEGTREIPMVSTEADGEKEADGSAGE